MKLSLYAFDFLLFFVRLDDLYLSDEEIEGTAGDGSIGRSLCAAGVDNRLRSRGAVLPGKLEFLSISSARIRRFIALEA